MNTKNILLIAMVALILSTAVHGQDFAPVGTAVAQFLEIGVGGRGTAMGEAYTALTNDAGSAFWNPAGLVGSQKRNLYTAYTVWPADISIGSLAFSMDLGNIGTFAISSAYLMTGDMEMTTVAMPEGTGENFSITNFALGLSYARFLTDRLSIGITTKLVREKYLDYGYTTWALDMGTLYRTGFHGLNLGMSILHFGPEVKFSGSYIDYSDPKSVDVNKPKSFETYSLPINFRIGISMSLLDTPTNKITTAADMIHPNNNLEQYNWGMEYCFNNMFFLRGGYRFNLDEGGFTFGTGVDLTTLGALGAVIDYSFADLGVLKSVHRFSLALTF
ncbi:MAG: PorV/PorQ family protein [candidate division KSB1 bacterium]|nr:PorV/PorQ family protein [candidate division KSB1 bacterium]MDZ7339938.1 PorV/PorQ family protein [candidate division KSB1 bacterium]